MNLMESLICQLNRNRELLAVYEGLGTVGKFGAMLIKRDIDAAEKAIGEGDLAEMIRCHEALKGHE